MLVGPLTEKERELYLSLIDAQEKIDDKDDFIKSMTAQYFKLQNDVAGLLETIDELKAEHAKVLQHLGDKS